jgi:hypothetical protein
MLMYVAKRHLWVFIPEYNQRRLGLVAQMTQPADLKRRVAVQALPCFVHVLLFSITQLMMNITTLSGVIVNLFLQN